MTATVVMTSAALFKKKKAEFIGTYLSDSRNAAMDVQKLDLRSSMDKVLGFASQ